MRRVYIVIAACSDRYNGDEKYIIDGVFSSEAKAKKRQEILNSRGLEWLIDNYGCGLFTVEVELIRTWVKNEATNEQTT